MNKIPSTPIKIAALFFLISGLLNIVPAIRNLTASSTSALALRDTISQIISIMTVIFSALSVLVGWFLIKLKRWSHILGIVLAILALMLHTLVLIKFGTTSFYSLALSLAILVLLIVGKKDFRTNP